MTKSEAKEWLKRGIELDDHINKLLEVQYKAYNIACNTTSCVGGEKVQTSRKNSTEDNLARYIDISAEADKCTDELYEIKQEIWQAVNRIEDKLLRRILKLRFVYFKPWGYIAHKAGRPVSSIKQHLLSKAIQEFVKTQHIE